MRVERNFAKVKVVSLRPITRSKQNERIKL